MNKLLLTLFLLASGTVLAQQPEDAQLLMVRMATTTGLTDDITGVVDVIMARSTFDQESVNGEIVGVIFDASVPSADIVEIPLTYFYDSDGTVNRMCDVVLYVAVIEEWEGYIPGYVMGEQDDTNCLGPIPVFAGF